MKKTRIPRWFLAFFIFIVLVFVVGNLNKLYVHKDSINGIRPDLYDVIVKNYHLVEKSMDGELTITLEIRNDAVGSMNNHGYSELTDEELEAASAINVAVHSRYLIDNELRVS